MGRGARRRRPLPWLFSAGRALWPAALWLTLTGAAAAQSFTGAEYEEPTDRYPHGALGDPVEHGALRVFLADGRAHLVRLPDRLVFEDTAPRLADVTGDGRPEILVVESDRELGARLAVWGLGDGEFRRLAATAFIGTRFRWLAPIGAADLDGDGRVEIAYVETPHLAKKLKIVRLEGGRLVPVAGASGLTNHRLGDPYIQGGVAVCGGRITLLTADADWRRIVGTAWDGAALTFTDFGPYRGQGSFAHVAGCSAAG